MKLLDVKQKDRLIEITLDTLTHEKFQKIITYLSKTVPEDQVFIFGSTKLNLKDSILNYASNGNRENIISILNQLIDQLESGNDFIQMFAEN